MPSRAPTVRPSEDVRLRDSRSRHDVVEQSSAAAQVGERAESRVNEGVEKALRSCDAQERKPQWTKVASSATRCIRRHQVAG